MGQVNRPYEIVDIHAPFTRYGKFTDFLLID